jgi:anaerobic magnesium-protoporphyrin IX monomethyl ester cyclase
MPSVLVAHSYFLRFDPKQFERAKPYPPLATLEVATLLRQHGHAPALFDAMLAEGVDDFARALAEAAPAVLVLYEDNYNYLSKMCLARMRDAACQMIQLAKATGARVLVAGSDVSDAPAPYVQAGADAALRGEGLEALPAVVEHLLRRPHAPMPTLPGVIHPATLPAPSSCADSGGSTVIQLPGQAGGGTDLAAAWDLIDVERYRQMWLRVHGRFSLNMAGSKGCSFRCSWCAKPIWGQRYQQRRAAAVAREMVALKLQLRPDHIWFADDIFGFRVDWVQRFADELQRQGGGLPFTIQTRADLISPAMARALREAGCSEVWLGAESGSQKVLDAMRKGTTVREIREARQLLGAEGIRVGFFIQLGYLGEGLPELLETRRLIEQTRPDDVGVSVAYPLPGTPFYEEVRSQLQGKTHWDDSADLAMMFQGAFDTTTYRQVRALLHAEVDARSPAERADVARRWEALLDTLQPQELSAALEA